MNQKWQAEEYTKGFSFVYQYGEDILSLIDLPKGSFCLDLGCGNGALTRRLQEQGYRVLGLDASGEMVSKAAADYPDLSFRQADARTFLLEEAADCIFSNAVFHWIDEADQPALAQNLYRNLRPGGQLVCEFGGKGNTGAILAELGRQLAGQGMEYRHGFYFPSLGHHAALLEEAGFSVRQAWLFRRPTPLAGGEEGLRNWVRMFAGEQLGRLEPARREQVLAGMEAVLRPYLWDPEKSCWVADYVRLRLQAVRED